MANVLDYHSKAVLAPMVRIGTLPTRLLALRYGADIVYTEEIIDFKMLKSTRVENEMLNTVDFVMDDGTVVFRTCPEEKSRVVFQIGTCDARRAVKVAKMVENDVRGFDVNMGCPKTFSISGGMGAALLRQPQKIKEILTQLVESVKIPVTCKIRCLDSLEDTINLVKLIESTGVVALAVHGRTRDERPRHSCRHSYIQKIAETVSIPVIANGGSGEIKSYPDIEKFRIACGSSSVMIARAAEWNVSIFRKEGLLDKDSLIRDYIKTAIDCDNHWTNTKYCLQQILGSDVQSGKGEQLLSARAADDIYTIYNMMEYYEQISSRHKEYQKQKQEELEKDLDTVNDLKVRIIRDDEGQVLSYESHHKFDRYRRLFPVEMKYTQGNATPKMFLIQYLRRQKIEPPTFEFEIRPVYKHFRCTLTHSNVKYISNQWHKRKVWAEHAVCEIYMQINGIENTEAVVKNGKTSNSQPATNSDAGKQLVDLAGEQIIVRTERDGDGDIISYSTDHQCLISSSGSSEDTSPSAYETLCKHLLKQGESEPECDVMNPNEEQFKCQMRINSSEYICTQWYKSKRDAVNACSILYLLVNQMPFKQLHRPHQHTGGLMNKADEGGREKRMKLSSK